MVARGHNLTDLLTLYPISTLTDLMDAARHNQREQQMLETQGMVVAVLHGLDGAFNKSKGKILKKYQDGLFPKRSDTSTGLSDAATKLLNFFAPRKPK
ncbi:MAG: hypothetical protein ACW99G_20340 [Candidatus Thorarchaeota archaeon]|jgi:hypothetical protein